MRMSLHLGCICLLCQALLFGELNRLLLRHFLGKVLFGEAAALEDDPEPRSEAGSPAFAGSSWSGSGSVLRPLLAPPLPAPPLSAPAPGG